MTRPGILLACLLVASADLRPSAPPAELANLSSIPCPSIFIYEDFPTFGNGTAPQLISVERAYGPALTTPGFFATEAFSFGEILFNRLYRSEHCRVTRDPTQADLFLIPTLLSFTRVGSFTRACSAASLAERNVRRVLRHLTPATEKKHVLFIVKGKSAVRNGASCAWIRGDTLPRVQRFALSHSYVGFLRTKWTKEADPVLDGRIVSVPYSSSFHWTREVGDRAPWKLFDDRETRIHYIGKPHGLQAALRAKLYADCRRLGKPSCQAETVFDHEKSLLQKRHAVFCLEPEGDSPYRKSLYDSIVMGCIPVLFSRDTDVSSPFHWGSFHAESRVLYSEQDYLTGKVTLASLVDMPDEDVRAMQASIAAHAQRLQYSFDDMPGGDDAVEVLLKKAALRASGVGLRILSS